jgi:hypothetical protein
MVVLRVGTTRTTFSAFRFNHGSSIAGGFSTAPMNKKPACYRAGPQSGLHITFAAIRLPPTKSPLTKVPRILSRSPQSTIGDIKLCCPGPSKARR